MIYVTYNESGELTGCYRQDLVEAHASNFIEVSEEQGKRWVNYEATEDRAFVREKTITYDIAAAKARKNYEINVGRHIANTSTFPYMGRFIACDPLSRSDIDGVAGTVAMTLALPPDFPMVWKATDNGYISIKNIQDFKDLYAAMIAHGTANFVHAQALKVALAAASTKEEIEAIAWEVLG